MIYKIYSAPDGFRGGVAPVIVDQGNDLATNWLADRSGRKVFTKALWLSSAPAGV